MMAVDQRDEQLMRRALQLAARGRGYVEPNPMVGCVIARQGQVVGEGWHRRFGGPHAEREALEAAGSQAAGATMYVTLEPCCHQGKTPPCCPAIVQAGIRRVVAATEDPFAQVQGGGIRTLRQAGIDVDVGLLGQDARELNAPYFKLIRTGRPWVIAKWAMSLDGKLATHTGDSRWISGEDSRAKVHQLRGLVDAVIVGAGTARRDDPLLTARPPGPRTATRVVVDTRASLSTESRLVQTAAEVPVLVAVGPEAPEANQRRLTDAGCEVLVCPAEDAAQRLEQLLDQLGSRRMTNVLVEGGGQLLGSFLDARLVDEVHVFIAPKLIGGAGAKTIAGAGIQRLADAFQVKVLSVEQLAGDLYILGRIRS